MPEENPEPKIEVRPTRSVAADFARGKCFSGRDALPFPLSLLVVPGNKGGGGGNIDLFPGITDPARLAGLETVPGRLPSLSCSSKSRVKPILVDGLGLSPSSEELHGFEGGGNASFSRAEFRLDNVVAVRALEAGSLTEGGKNEDVEKSPNPDIDVRFSGDNDDGFVMTNGL